MILIVGLGNPGKKYIHAWHNLGFLVIDKFKEINNFPDFKLSKKSISLISMSLVDNKKIILVKPQTFMNLSGKTVKRIINYQLSIINKFSINQFSNKNLIIVHDDIDIPLGKIRISKGRGSAGHKGVQSIINELKTKDFVRFRIGIKPANSEQRTANNLNIEKTSARAKLGAGLVPHRNKVSGAGFVLQKFDRKQEKIIKEIIGKTAEAIEISLKEGLEKAMNRFNK